MDKFTIYKGKKYKLTGKCLKCGKCCIGQVTYLTQIDDKIGKCIVKDVNLANPTFDISKGYCPMLDIKTNLCTIQNEKSAMCSEWPRLYQELALFPDCGYKWKFVCDTNEPDTILEDIENDKKYQH